MQRTPADPANAAAPPNNVQLNLPDNMELKLFIDFVSQRLGVRILYDDAINNQKITIKAPDQIPADTLDDLLQSVLKIKGFAIVDADVAGWKRIVKVDKLSNIAQPDGGRPLVDLEATEAITQSFPLKHVTPERIEEIIKPFLTEGKSDTIKLPTQNTLIITDYAGNLKRLAQLIASVDRPGPESVLKFYAAEHVDASALQKQIIEVLTARLAGTKIPGSAPLQITIDARTNKLLFIGPPDEVDAAMELAKSFDIPLGIRSQVYSFQFVEAERIDKLIRDLLDPLTVERLYRSSIDETDNLLIVSTTADIHQRIAALQQQMDLESKRADSDVKFYKLRFADAAEVLQTIQSIQSGTTSLDRFGERGVSPLGRGRWNDSQYGYPMGYDDRFVPGPNQPGIPGSYLPATTPAYRPPPEEALVNVNNVTVNGPQADAANSLLPNAARVTADPTTNSIIVVGDRGVQQTYKDLIEFLDRRRPQVMIEAKIVILDTSDNFALGIELSGGDRIDPFKVFNFTSYGLSMVDAATGALSLIPGRGYNFTLVEPDIADAVLRALATHRRARVMSSPRILVNDNATGTLASVAEVPFTSVNASNVVATTSFAGFAEAGTTITCTPRITDDNHLDLDYVLTLNSFTGAGGDGVPPPRQTDELSSNVTIPDGYTVIVGGLNRENSSQFRESVPYLEQIPLLRVLLSNRTSANSKSTLFVFLRPVILRDDKFADLKYISDRDLKCSTICPNFPVSQPVIVK